MTNPSTFRERVERMTTFFEELVKKYDGSTPPGVDEIRQSLDDLPKGIDRDIVAHMFWVLSRQTNHADPIYTRAGPYDTKGYGVKIDAGKNLHVASLPGGLTLFASGEYYTTPILNLGMAFDITDGPLTHIRNSIVYALDQTGIDYVPLSLDAIGNVGGIAQLKLIDRQGLNCVFSTLGRREKICYMISGYDENEDPPLYFMAQLPRKPKNYQDALEILKPKSVKEAEKLGLSVLRQGDMFFIPTPYTKEDLIKMDATISDEVEIPREAFVGRRMFTWGESWSDGQVVKMETYRMADGRELPVDDEGMINWTETRKRGLYGTAHTADQIAYLPDGTQFARGVVHHDPVNILNEQREPDHQPLKLPGRKWYLVARNTVPVQK